MSLKTCPVLDRTVPQRNVHLICRFGPMRIRSMYSNEVPLRIREAQAPAPISTQNAPLSSAHFVCDARVWAEGDFDSDLELLARHPRAMITGDDDDDSISGLFPCDVWLEVCRGHPQLKQQCHQSGSSFSLETLSDLCALKTATQTQATLAYFQLKATERDSSTLVILGGSSFTI